MLLVLLTAALILLANARRWPLVPLGLTMLLLGTSEWRIERVQHSWSGAHGEREARIERASGRLQQELRRASNLADSLAHQALAVENLPREVEFAAVADLISPRAIESGVVVFEPSNRARVWGGRFRLLPDPSGDSVGIRLTPYYAVLEVRRHARSGRTAVAAVLLASDPAVPDQERSLASRFRERTEV